MSLVRFLLNHAFLRRKTIRDVWIWPVSGVLFPAPPTCLGFLLPYARRVTNFSSNTSLQCGSLGNGKGWQNVESLVRHHYRSKWISFPPSLGWKELKVEHEIWKWSSLSTCAPISVTRSHFCNLYSYEAAWARELPGGEPLPMVPQPGIPLPQSCTLTHPAHVTALVSANDGSIMPANIALLSKRPPSSTPCKCLSDSQQIRHRQRDVK